jgi:translin
MSLKKVKSSLQKISKSLEISQTRREYLLKNSRDVIILCSQSIIAVHKEDLQTAKSKLKKANELLINYRKKAVDDLQRYIITAEQEFVEATALLAVVERKEIPSNASLKVSGESYTLGLLDCIGELKRLVYDKIRNGESKKAAKYFEIMENLYLYLYPFATYDKIVKEIRRKLDVNRILVEETRAALTEEIRRAKLIDAIKNVK